MQVLIIMRKTGNRNSCLTCLGLLPLEAMGLEKYNTSLKIMFPLSYSTATSHCGGLDWGHSGPLMALRPWLWLWSSSAPLLYCTLAHRTLACTFLIASVPTLAWSWWCWRWQHMVCGDAFQKLEPPVGVHTVHFPYWLSPLQSECLIILEKISCSMRLTHISFGCNTLVLMCFFLTWTLPLISCTLRSISCLLAHAYFSLCTFCGLGRGWGCDWIPVHSYSLNML